MSVVDNINYAATILSRVEHIPIEDEPLIFPITPNLSRRHSIAVPNNLEDFAQSFQHQPSTFDRVKGLELESSVCDISRKRRTSFCCPVEPGTKDPPLKRRLSISVENVIREQHIHSEGSISSVPYQREDAPNVPDEYLSFRRGSLPNFGSSAPPSRLRNYSFGPDSPFAVGNMPLGMPTNEQIQPKYRRRRSPPFRESPPNCNYQQSPNYYPNTNSPENSYDSPLASRNAQYYNNEPNQQQFTNGTFQDQDTQNPEGNQYSQSSLFKSSYPEMPVVNQNPNQNPNVSPFGDVFSTSDGNTFPPESFQDAQQQNSPHNFPLAGRNLDYIQQNPIEDINLAVSVHENKATKEREEKKKGLKWTNVTDSVTLKYAKEPKIGYGGHPTAISQPTQNAPSGDGGVKQNGMVGRWKCMNYKV